MNDHIVVEVKIFYMTSQGSQQCFAINKEQLWYSSILIFVFYKWNYKVLKLGFDFLLCEWNLVHIGKLWKIKKEFPEKNQFFITVPECTIFDGNESQ